MSVKRDGAKAVADVSAGLILASVEIAAPPERVFRALTDPNELPKWWGSDDTYRVESAVNDVRVGGTWQSRGRNRAGKEFGVRGEYLEVDPPRRLVYTWVYDWDGGGAPTTVAYTLETIDGGTRVTVRHSGFGANVDSCRGHAEGWERVLGWLRAHVEPAPPSGV